MKKIKDKKIKIKPMQAESFETTLERYGQGRLFQINDNLSKAKKIIGLSTVVLLIYIGLLFLTAQQACLYSGSS